ncbi:MAG: HEAT repeat domain-containing protein [Planctomycetota bacterium]
MTVLVGFVRLLVLMLACSIAGCSIGVDRELLDRIAECEVRRDGIEFLIVQSESSNDVVRQAACHALARLADPASEAVLARAATDPDPKIAREAIFGLGRIPGTKESPALVAALRGSDASSRLLAATAIGQRGDPASLDVLLWVASSDPEPRVREAAALAMARVLGDPLSSLSEARCEALAAQLVELAGTATTQGQATAILRARLALPVRWAAPVADFSAASTPTNAAERERRRAAITWLRVNGHLDADRLARLRDDPDPVVRRILDSRRDRAAATTAPPTAAPTTFAVPGRDVPFEFLGSRPVLTFTTARGSFDLALAPAVAPVHCWLLWQAAHRGHLDGTTIVDETPAAALVLVAPATVVDDDGGSRRWPLLRSEPGTLPFARGTLGVEVSNDLDLGAGQFLLTLQGAPELDGRATAIGRVVKGFDVVEALVVGDVIHRVSESKVSR